MKNRSTVSLDVKLSSNTSLIATILLLFFTSQLEAQSMTVKDNASVTVISGTNVFVKGALSVADNSSVVFNNNSNLIQTDNVPNSGNITIRRNSSALIRYDYTYWSSPVSGQNLLNFSPLTVTNRFYTFNEVTNAFVTIDPSVNNFQAAKGYMLRAPNTFNSVPTVYNGVFSGTPNNGNYAIAISTTNISQGFNLIGNPYPSPISAFEFLKVNPGTLHFWTHTNQGAGTGTNYASINELGAITNVPNGEVPNGDIQTGQGFLIQTSTNGNAVFTNAMRVDNTDGQFFKSNTIEKHRLWLNLSTPNVPLMNQILIGYIQGATQNFDASFDGGLLSSGSSTISSRIGSDDYVIQGRALPFSNTDSVYLGFNAIEAGSFTISLDHADGVFNGTQDVFLRDNLLNVLQNLKIAPYTFTSSIGMYNNRFSLVYTSSPLGTPTSNFNTSDVILFMKDNTITINTGSNNIKDIIVYDIQGRLLLSKDNINAPVATISELRANQQIVIVQITSHDDIVVVKKVVF